MGMIIMSLKKSGGRNSLAKAAVSARRLGRLAATGAECLDSRHLLGDFILNKSAALKIPISAASNRVLRDFFLRIALLNVYGINLPLSISGASPQVLLYAL